MKQDRFPTTPEKLAPSFPLSLGQTLWLLLGSIFLLLGPRLNAAPVPRPPHHLPSTFEENHGQAPADVKWIGHSANYLLLFEEDGVTFVLPDKNNRPIRASGRPPGLDHPSHLKYNFIQMKLPGAHSWKSISGLQPTGGISNYLSPGEATSRLSGIPQYQQVRVAGVYDGVDLVFYNDGDNLEYDFVLAPGADPARIQLAFTGTSAVDVDERSGDLVLSAQDGSQLRQHRPNVYQQAGSDRVAVQAAYRKLGQGRAAFTLATYDRTRALTIDPTVDFTTFFGGSDEDDSLAIAVDSSGNTYMTGATNSTNFPVTNASSFDKPKDFSFLGFVAIGPNVFVAKLDPAGKLIYASYGGVGEGNAITLDDSGVYVAGEVFPPEGDNVIGYNDNSDGDSFVFRLESREGFKDYYHVFGPVGTDYATAIGVDSAHDAWVTGATYIGRSSNNPTSGNVFITEFAPDGRYKTNYSYGSDKEDVPHGLLIGPETNDRAWITGKTCGSGFPTTDGITHELSHCGVFVLALENSGVQDLGMVFGGSDGDDEGQAIAPNGPNSVYIAGSVASSNFPTTQGAFATFKNAGSQGFVMQIDSSVRAGQIAHSTFFDSDGITTPLAIATATGKGVYVGGVTTSTHLPGGPSLAPNPTAGFVTKFSLDLSQVRYTQLLGLAVTGIRSILLHASPPEIYTTGYRYSGSHTYAHIDAFAVKLDEITPSSGVASLPEQVDDPAFNITWSGTDSSNTIASYDIYVSDDGGPFTLLQPGTAATSAIFTGATGHTYGFFSVATDTAGNREPMKGAPDTVVRVGPPPPIHITCNNCSFDIDSVKAAVSLNVNTANHSGSFTFNNGNTSAPMRFASTDITRTSVVGNSATIYGDGTLNGTGGYTFTISATDAGGPGSNMDAILVQLFGPNNFTFNAPSVVTGGDVVVQP